MNIGIIYSTEKRVIEKLVNGLKRGLEEQGNTVMLFPDNSTTFSGLASCRHIFVGSFITAAFKPKTPPRLRDALSKVPGISGKRSIAFIASGGLGARKALLVLMNDMEKQGCFIIDQKAFSSENDAYQFGKTIKLKDV
ncbi:MAG: hypothetical protein DRP55_07330 [Spirochaetes bacterium]|nr:MAG: hypothetical protein DRP55_07330 [Spirochaetota bacterium]